MERDVVESAARNSEFPQDSLEKIMRLARLCDSIAGHPLLSRVLALKGGTALNMFAGPPPRLSVDLDFNYIGGFDRETLDVDRPEVERRMEELGRAGRYEIQWSRPEHAGRKIFLKYRSASGTPDRIEVDLNFLHRVPLTPPHRVEMWQPEGLPRPTVQLCGLEEVAAGKIAATLDRSKPRDLFDLGRLPRLAQSFWSQAKFKRLVVAFTATLNHPLHSYGHSRLARVRPVEIAAELQPMLARSQSIDRDELIGEAWRAVGPLLDLDDAEREFVDRVQAGELRLDLLFPADSPLRGRFEKWPPLLWKIQNAAKHRRGNSPDTAPGV